MSSVAESRYRVPRRVDKTLYNRTTANGAKAKYCQTEDIEA
jgi:hypothetical protein